MEIKLKCEKEKEKKEGRRRQPPHYFEAWLIAVGLTCI
jgi:hypothetical protein